MSGVKNGDGKNEERKGKAEKRGCALDGVWSSGTAAIRFMGRSGKGDPPVGVFSRKVVEWPYFIGRNALFTR